MKEQLLLDVSGILDKETFHEYISKKLNFPGYYGYNLDALWDSMTDEGQSTMPKILIVEGLAQLKDFLPDLHDSFIKCLTDYEKEYPERKVIYKQNSPSGEGIKFEK